MNEKEFLLNILKQTINDYLDILSFKICNTDWEYNFEATLKVEKELEEALLEDKPESIYSYIKEHLEKYYPYNFNK